MFQALIAAAMGVLLWWLLVDDHECEEVTWH